MNLYFLLEDEKSFLKILPGWLEYIGLDYSRVPDIKEVQENNYVLQSGHGVTQLVTKVLFDTIDTLILNPGKIDKLVIILDSEELTIEERKKRVEEQINNHYPNINFAFDIIILVCNCCFETWLLGCKGLYPLSVEEKSFFYQYYHHYNVETHNPEEMMKPAGSNETTAKFHFHYLHELLRYKGIRYSKNKPDYVATENYFKGLVERIDTTEHLNSFRTFYNFISSVKEK